MRVETLKHKIRSIQSEIQSIQDDCKHEYLPIETKNGLKLGHKNCPKCDKEFWEWWCPKNKSTFCEYDEDEWCIHCGEPDERK